MMVLPQIFLSLIFLCFSLFPKLSISIDTITPNQTLSDNDIDTLVSEAQTFELAFFSPFNSKNRYVGIWFKNIPQQTPVWVANKNNPLTNSSGVLRITTTGNIVITNNLTGVIIWSSNSSSSTATDPTLQLLDTGNLVVRDGNSGDYIWQSFDYPCDTLIPGMKFGWDLQKNKEWYLSSWKSLQDPSTGDYTYRVDPRGLPQVILRQGLTVEYRSGPWDGVRFGGGPKLGQNPIVYTPIFIFDTNNVYYSFKNIDGSTISRFVLNQTGLIEHLMWSQTRSEWVDIVTLQGDQCDEYSLCGPYGICDVNGSPVCQCPKGFKPRLPQDWSKLDWSGGCVPNTPLNCTTHDVGFLKIPRLKLPDASHFLVNMNAKSTSKDCEMGCLENCSCVAYARTDFGGCVVWYGDLLDIRDYKEGGQDLYFRMSTSDLGSNNRKRTGVIASVSIISGFILLGLISYFVIRRRAAQRREATPRIYNPRQCNTPSILEEDLELPLFDLVTISTATNNFSFTHKIGEGGFGPVYKGKLSTGQEIAVKRLSEDSGQGIKEFKNEVILIAKLQHRNLVKLLGCCIHGGEKMLVYEYMPNKSLDLFIFKPDQTGGTSLEWQKRFDILVGIARGLLYLHRDSRLRIIHRDLKASNILLDSQMNPKISDFGMARIFGSDQSEDNTKRVVGTYGYMSPEYAIDGLFSVKSDVFSFGVLVLEIVSGKKNRGFCHPDHDLNLLGHAWKMWNEGSPMKLKDASMDGQISESEILRCIHVGLLCVQQRPDDRPAMSSVLLMFDSENPNLAQPKQPGFYTERFPNDTDSSSTGRKISNSNEVTMSMLYGR